MERPVIIEIYDENENKFVIDNENYMIPSDGLSGLELPDYTLYSSNMAFKEGAIVTGESYGGRPIEITFVARTNANEERELIRRFFQPRRYYILYITYRGVTRWIIGRLQARPIPSENVWKPVECTLNFFCEDPFFNSCEEKWKDLQEKVPMWHFPYVSTAEHPAYFSKFRYGSYIKFNNNGDIDTAFACYMYFTGEVTNPAIYQGYRDANLKFELIGTFDENDIIFIDMDTGIVLINDETGWDKVSIYSKLLKVPIGGTVLSCIAEEGQTLMHCIVAYNERFTGM